MVPTITSVIGCGTMTGTVLVASLMREGGSWPAEPRRQNADADMRGSCFARGLESDCWASPGLRLAARGAPVLFPLTRLGWKPSGVLDGDGASGSGPDCGRGLSFRVAP